MKQQAKSVSVRDVTQHIRPDTPEMEAYLGVGYGGMTVEKAEAIIRERKENPALWPYEELQKAEAFLAAYHAKPEAVSTDPGWQRDRAT